jgi:hypothetical protein
MTRLRSSCRPQSPTPPEAGSWSGEDVGAGLIVAGTLTWAARAAEMQRLGLKVRRAYRSRAGRNDTGEA